MNEREKIKSFTETMTDKQAKRLWAVIKKQFGIDDITVRTIKK